MDPSAEVKTQVVFTNGSTFEVGGTAAVDFLKTSQNVMNDPNIMADMYNAALEQAPGSAATERVRKASLLPGLRRMQARNMYAASVSMPMMN